MKKNGSFLIIWIEISDRFDFSFIQRGKMIIYEVNCTVQNQIYLDFKAWLKIHIDEMLQLPGFIKAETFLHSDLHSSTERCIVIQYHLDSEESLEEYFSVFAPQMRSDGIKQFGGYFSITRRVLSSYNI